MTELIGKIAAFLRRAHRYDFANDRSILAVSEFFDNVV